MSDYKVPAGWKFYGSKENQTTFTGPGHTVATPYLLIFDRVVPSPVNQLSVSRYRMRVIRGELDTDGNPRSIRPLLDCWIRWPLASTPSIVEEIMAMAGLVLSDAAFQDDVVVEGLLPREVTVGGE